MLQGTGRWALPFLPWLSRAEDATISVAPWCVLVASNVCSVLSLLELKNKW